MSALSEGRKSIRAAKHAGFSTPQARREVFQQIAGARGSIKGTLTPEMTEALLDRIERGDTVRDNRPILSLGSALIEIENRFREGDDGLSREEVGLLNHGTRILWRNVLNGNLATRMGEAAGTVAFIANRLGKIKEHARDPRLYAIKLEDLESLMIQVRIFAEDELSDERLHAKQEKVSKRLEEIGAIREVIPVNQAIRTHEIRIETLQATLPTLLTSPELDMEFEEITRFLNNAIPKVEGVTDLPQNKWLAQTLRPLQSYYRANQGRNAALSKLQYESLLPPGTEISARAPLPGPTEYGGLKRDDYQRAIAIITAYIEKKKAEKAKKTAVPKKGFGDLKTLVLEQNLPELERIATLLNNWISSSTPGAFGRIKKVSDQIKKERDGIGVLQTNKMMNTELRRIEERFQRWQRCKKQIDQLCVDPEKGRVAFQRSIDRLLAYLREHPERDLYFIKSFCVAADLEQRQERGGPSCFIPAAGFHESEISTYHFVKPGDPGPQKETSNTYTDIHYRSSDLPFCLMAVEFFKSLK